MEDSNRILTADESHAAKKVNGPCSAISTVSPSAIDAKKGICCRVGPFTAARNAVATVKSTRWMAPTALPRGRKGVKQRHLG